MSTELIYPAKICIVRRNTDGIEGRGPMVPVCAAADRTIAASYIKERCNDGLGSFDTIELPLYSITNPPPTLPDEARARALAKLTPEERKLLGLS